MRYTRVRFLGVVGCAVGVAGGLDWAAAAEEPCEPGWSRQVPQWLLATGPQQMVAWDDGAGPALFALVRFADLDGWNQFSLGRWDGYTWEQRSSSFDLLGPRLTVADFGAGRVPVVSGWLRERIGDARARLLAWRDGDWLELPTPPGGYIENLVEFDDGAGTALYAAFADWRSGSAVGSVLRWTEGGWSPLPGRANGTIRTLAVHDDGHGPALFAGGDFNTVDGQVIGGVVRWDGIGWTPPGTDKPRGDIRHLVSFDDGTGRALFALGAWILTDGTGLGGAYCWRGAEWESLGLNGTVNDARVATDASGTALFVVGDLVTGGATTCRGVARWTATGWNCAGTQIWSGPVRAVCADPSPPGPPRVYVGGDFSVIGGPGAYSRHLVAWTGSEWQRMNRETSGAITAFLGYATPAGPRLAIGGRFHGIGDTFAHEGALFDGTRWMALPGLSGPPNAFAVFDDGRGAALYAAGASAGQPSAAYLRRWDGETWETIALPAGAWIRALQVFDDGRGPALYLAGESSPTVGGFTGVARWDGVTLNSLDGRIGTNFGGDVAALAVFPVDGRPALVAAGWFDFAGTTPATNIASWDGTTWRAVPTGLDRRVYTLARVDTPVGPVLYAGGTFEPSSDQPWRRIAAWDGRAWSALGTGVGSAMGHAVRAIGTFDDGRGPALIVGGLFDRAGEVEVRNLARWDGQAWTAFGGGTDGRVDALAVFDADATGPHTSALFVGGDFFGVEGGLRRAPYLGAWKCLPSEMPGDLDCDGRVTVRDIDPFALALSRPSAYWAAFPDCFVSAADVNADGRVDVFDIDAFVALVAGGGP